MGSWLGWSGRPRAWGAGWGTDAGDAGERASGGGGELGKGQARAGAGGGRGRAGLRGWRGGAGGGGAGRRGAHRAVGEVESEVGGNGPEGQLLRGDRSAGRALPQSSMKMGFTNQRRSFPPDRSISHMQFSSWEVDLRLQAGGTLGAGSFGGSAGLPAARRGFSEESQKPVETREEEVVSPRAGPLGGVGWCGGRGTGGLGGPYSFCFSAPPVVFPSRTVLNLSHHFLPLEGKPREILP